VQLQSHMNHNFGNTPTTNIQRSAFDRSFSHKTTFNAGYLIPFYADEVLPGDTFNLSSTIFARMTTPIFPVMDNLFLDTHFFFVPLRLVWDNFQKFMGEQNNPGDSTDYVCPTSTAPVGGYANQSLQDYLTLPTQVAGYTHNVFHTRAYNLIYNQHYRDENMQNSVVVNKGDGPDTVTDYVLLKRGKRFDYFTSCLPWAQKGAAVSLPLGTTAPVVSDGTNPQFLGVTSNAPSNLQYRTSGTAIGYGVLAGTPVNNETLRFNASATGLVTNLSSATSATINQLRQAFQIQTLLERDARGGTRYTEIIRSHFSVISPDARLQRAEYLGGGSTPINITPVAQTSANASQPTPQGNLAAMATATAHNHGFTKSFTEHGVILGILSVRADLTYQQGLNRMYSRSTRYDFFWPALAQIGEQSVLNKEIYTQGNATDALVFGYQERFGEYRSKLSSITGKFRSNDAQTLNSWHLAQSFSSLPVLNNAFITENPPMSRVLAVANQPDFLMDSFNKLICVRPMPVYGIPYDLGRF